MSVEQLINVAYITNGERLLNDDPGYVQWPSDGGEGRFVRPTERIRGGPSWAHSDKYTIDAKAEGTPDRKVMNGPMLRALLEDRFQLKIHRDVDQDVAMFALAVAKGGPKIKPWGATDECTEWDRATQKPPPMKEVLDMVRRGERPPCGLGVMVGTNGANRAFAMNGEPMDGVAYWLSSTVGRHILNKTGLNGKYTLYLEYAPEGSTEDPAGPSIFTAVQEQWGLKLEPAKGPRGFIAIDRVERPSVGGSAAMPSQSPGPIPKFDVVSIKPCKGSDNTSSGGRGAGPGGAAASPGRLHIDCLPLVGKPSLMRQAYAVHATGRLAAVWVDLPIEGGPAWTRSDRFTIEAKAEGTPGMEMMRGPMLQALLEEKFHLTTHRETHEIPVYELSVAKGGSKLRPFDGHCTPVDSTKGDLPAQLEATGACPISMAGTKVDATGETIDDFIRFVLTFMDRPVVDKTGLSGRFDIHLELPPDLASDEVPSALASAVLQQLGLKISPAKGPGDTLVIDHVERPDGGR